MDGWVEVSAAGDVLVKLVREAISRKIGKLLQRAMLIRAPPMGQLATTQFRIFDEAKAAFVLAVCSILSGDPAHLDAPQLYPQGRVGFGERIGDLSFIENQTQY
jgi:hypothetical protein